MLKQQLIGSSKYGIKCPYTMAPQGICIHNTANDAPAKNEAEYMTNNDMEVSFHIVVDDVEAIQLIPFDRNAWAAGDGGSGNGNRSYIHLEICYSRSGGDRFINAEKRAAKEVAALLKQFGWTIANVRKHQDFSGKYCPHRTLDMGWQRFLNMIQAELNLLNVSNLRKEEEKKKVKGIVIYGNDIDRRAAEYLADGLGLPTINAATNFDYSTVEQSGIYAVGGDKGTYTSYLRDENFISGSDRFETVKAVLNKLGKL